MDTKRIAMNAVMIGVYVVLSMLAIPIGGFKITFEHFPVVLCAVIFGPVDAMLVGGIGELFNQLTTFGVTPTTVLWVLPIVFRGLILGLCVKIFKKQMDSVAIRGKKFPVVFLCVCVISGILSSFLNTFALYIDSKMFGYYTDALVFGSLSVRILLSSITSVIIGLTIKAVVHALYKSRLV